MSALARSAFALLVCATFAAFFAAQELKSTPPRVQDLKTTPFFSPNRDGRFDRARASFVLKRTDDVTATVIDRGDDEVRVLRSRHPPARRRDDAPRLGRPARQPPHGADGDVPHPPEPAPPGPRRRAAAQHRQGHEAAPDVRVTSIGPEKDKVPEPELLPRADGAPARVSFRAPDRHKELVVFRTDVSPPRPVFDKPVELADDARRWEWDGTANGRRVAGGTYVVVVRARDQAGNVGTSAPVPPRPAFGRGFPGRGGITVRYLSAQASSEPVAAGTQAAVVVTSPGRRFTWTLRRVAERRIRKRGRGSRSRLVRFVAPRGKSGLYLFEVRQRGRRGRIGRKAAAPVLVQSAENRDVLVVLPVTTWQGVNPVDDDGDGRPDTLGAGVPIRIGRPFVKTGLPAQLPKQEALLLAQLDREGHRYDLTSDVALARGEGPTLTGHRGVILAGDTRWLDPNVSRSLRGFVRAGGTLFSAGTQSLRRTAQLTPRGRAIEPTLPTARDLFGARLRPIERPDAPATLTNIVDDIQLFAGTEGQFSGIGAFEQTLDVRGGSGAIAAAAATQDGERRPSSPRGSARASSSGPACRTSPRACATTPSWPASSSACGRCW